MTKDYADVESGFPEEICTEFLKRIKVIPRKELTEQKIEKLRELFPTQYNAALDHIAQELGVTD